MITIQRVQGCIATLFFEKAYSTPLTFEQSIAEAALGISEPWVQSSADIYVVVVLSRSYDILTLNPRVHLYEVSKSMGSIEPIEPILTTTLLVMYLKPQK